jgi:hypothetical protein
VRDVFRDFCIVHRELDRQFQSYDKSGVVSFEFMRDLLGEEMNKGQLWRLKDTAHLLFRSSEKEQLVGRYLDWSIGYIFHECIKLKEDAYQRQIYGPWFEQIKAEQALTPEEKLLGQELFQVILQTRESILREITRIRFILFHCRRMLIVYLTEHGENPLLARFIYDQSDLVHSVFPRRLPRADPLPLRRKPRGSLHLRLPQPAPGRLDAGRSRGDGAGVLHGPQQARRLAGEEVH